MPRKPEYIVLLGTMKNHHSILDRLIEEERREKTKMQYC